MSGRLEARAELVKLARLLGTEPDELAFLAEVPPDALRDFRAAATDRLYAGQAGQLFGRIGAAAGLLPSAVVATVAERAFGPLLCARAVVAVDPAKAVDVMRRLPPEFVAEATVLVDPRRITALIAAVPDATVVEVARILAERREYVTMGRFLAYVPDGAVLGAITALPDEALLRTAFVLEHKDRLDHAVALLPPERLAGVLECASELDLWPEALDLLDHLSEARRGPIADTVAGGDPEVVAGLVAAVSAAGIWDVLLPIVRLMAPESRERIAAAPAFHDRRVLAEIIVTTADAPDGLWADLAPLVGALPPDVRRVAAEVAGALSADRLERIVTEALRSPEAIAPLLALLAVMDDDGLRRVGDAIVAVVGTPEAIPAEVLEAVAAAAGRLAPADNSRG